VSSAPIGSGSHVSAASPVSSCHQTSRSCHGTGSPVRRRTTTRFTPGARAQASSAFAFSGTFAPLRHPSSWVMSTDAPESRRRSESDSAEKPPKTTMCGAPIRAHASIAAGNSGTIPM
jgi:hypothetical protein